MRKALALVLTSLLIATTLPTNVAADEPEIAAKIAQPTTFT